MDKTIVVTKRFRKNTLGLFEYLLKNYSEKIAFNFLNKPGQRVELIIRHPEIGKPSKIRPNVRSVTLQPHNRIYYRLKTDIIELLCLFDMRKENFPY